MMHMVSVFEEMVEKEKEYAKRLRSVAEKVRHPLLRTLLLGIANDSEKHSKFYEGMARLAKGSYPLVQEEGFEELKAGIDEHIRLEAEMIRLTKKWAKETKDPKLRLLLMAVNEDEVRHHKLLLDIKKNLAEGSVFSEEELWEAIWRDSPWHGAPGG